MARPVLLRNGPGPARARWRRWPVAAAVALALPPAAHAAAFLPGADEPDPPTGERPAPAAEAPANPLAGPGIRWVLAPWRHAGTLAVDARRLRFEDGRQATQGTLQGDIDFASHVHEPWFIQLRGGIGGLLVADRVSAGAGAPAERDRSSGLTGRLQVAVFPASRFPFELRADAGDTRTSGDTLGSDYRSLRVSASQAWRPEVGNDSVTLNADWSRLSMFDGGTDRLAVFSANAQRETARHTFEAGGSTSRNERQDRDTVEPSSTELAAAMARHAFHPGNGLRTETLATWNEARVRGDGREVGSDVRQLSTTLTWRPQEGEPLYAAERPLTLAASARWVQAGALGRSEDPSAGGPDDRVRAVNATLGLTQDLSRTWRASASAGAGRLAGRTLQSSSSNLNASLAWTALPVMLGGWRWAPGASVSGGATRSDETGARRLAGAQGQHALSRDVALGEGDALAFTFTQSAAVLRESNSTADSRAVAHGASVYWQSPGDGGSPAYAGLSLSDARTWSPEPGRFTLANLQWSQRVVFSRFSSFAAHVTVQFAQSSSTQTDPFTGQTRLASDGWQRYYSGSASYEQQRLFDVPRLRWSLAAGASSQQLDRRANGDLDAPVEHVSASLESRLDYAIGRLDARLSARAARVDGRTVAALVARVQRRF